MIKDKETPEGVDVTFAFSEATATNKEIQIFGQKEV